MASPINLTEEVTETKLNRLKKDRHDQKVQLDQRVQDDQKVQLDQKVQDLETLIDRYYVLYPVGTQVEVDLLVRTDEVF